MSKTTIRDEFDIIEEFIKNEKIKEIEKAQVIDNINTIRVLLTEIDNIIKKYGAQDRI